MIDKPSKAVIEKIRKTRNTKYCVATSGNDHVSDVERKATAKGIKHSMDVHDKVYTDKTLKVKATIEAQFKTIENNI